MLFKGLSDENLSCQRIFFMASIQNIRFEADCFMVCWLIPLDPYELVMYFNVKEDIGSIIVLC